jgi:hypothetical protein
VPLLEELQQFHEQIVAGTTEGYERLQTFSLQGEGFK